MDISVKETGLVSGIQVGPTFDPAGVYMKLEYLDGYDNALSGVTVSKSFFIQLASAKEIVTMLTKAIGQADGSIESTVAIKH